jgi:protein gp37
MAQTKDGARIIAAKKIGIPLTEYLDKCIEEKWCYKCRSWENKNKFNVDNSRGDGLSAKCHDCVRVKIKICTKGRPSPMKGKKFTGQALKNMRAASKKRRGTRLSSPKVYTPEGYANLIKAVKKPRPSIQGSNNSRWKGDRKNTASAQRELNKTPLIEWRISVFERDKYTCMDCGDKRGGNLEAHHIKEYAKFPALRHEISNGKTLCKTCHKKAHFKPNSTRNLRKLKKMGKTKIEWTSPLRSDGTPMPGYTANLWWGCAKIHRGCDFCYAETLSNRWGNDIWGVDKPRKVIKSVWKDLEKYQKLAKEKGEVHSVFVGSMMDIFEKPMPMINSKGEEVATNTGYVRDIFFNSIVPNSPNLMFLLLTKRPSNINKYIPEEWKLNPPENVMFGTSPVDQPTSETLINHLKKVNGKLFLSVEPQLAHIEFGDLLDGISWVINGGESGHGRRPFSTDWARSIRDECQNAGVPFFFKQIDKVLPIPDDLMVREFPANEIMQK